MADTPISAEDPTAIISMTEAHWPEVAAVFETGIATGHATFETEAPTWEAFSAARPAEHRHVAVDAAGRVLGWTAVSPISTRAVYAGVVEHGLYVHPDARGRGIGPRLLQALINSTEEAGIWTIQSGIFPENTVSLAVHEAARFRVVGTRERLGRMRVGPMAGQWRDVVLVERRSALAGV
ncbi:GNAT family N-acetyltransferase [Nocardioides fonticola]|uniref:GNAT family N-acetyltransferase n=1 Tax=Nocardioides fonticola TaxID=450363 RepID=A0ABP7Y2U3_9ACTN